MTIFRIYSIAYFTVLISYNIPWCFNFYFPQWQIKWLFFNHFLITKKVRKNKHISTIAQEQNQGLQETTLAVRNCVRCWPHRYLSTSAPPEQRCDLAGCFFLTFSCPASLPFVPRPHWEVDFLRMVLLARPCPDSALMFANQRALLFLQLNEPLMHPSSPRAQRLLQLLSFPRPSSGKLLV